MSCPCYDAGMAERSPKTVQRAKETYGDRPTNPAFYVYAKLIAEGKSQYAAFIEAFPHAREWNRSSVDSQASILAAHPKMDDLIASHAYGTRNVALALAPAALQRHVELMQQTDDLGVAARMVDSLHDRAELPRVKESRVSGLIVSAQLMASLTLDPSQQELDDGQHETDSENTPARGDSENRLVRGDSGSTPVRLSHAHTTLKSLEASRDRALTLLDPPGKP